jgi:phosphoenolpyruvate synthase/pyruvate phosphate dikinase
MKFEDIAKKKWYIQGFNSCLNFIFHGPVSGMVDCHKTLGYGYSEMLLIFKKDYLDYHYLEQDLADIGSSFFSRYKKDSAYIDKVLKIEAGLVKDAEKVMALIDSKDLKKLSKKELLNLYQSIWDAYHTMLGTGHIIEGISFVAEPLLKEKLEKATALERHSKEFREIFTQLLQPERPSFINDETLGLLKIVAIVKKDGFSDDALKKISRHRKKFFYNQINYFDGESLKEEDYIKEIKNLVKDDVDVEEKIKEESSKYGKNIIKRHELIKKYRLNAETSALIRLLVTVLHWQDDRKKNILSCVYYMHKLLKELGDRFSIPLEMLKRYSQPELTYKKLDNFDIEEAKERMNHYIVYTRRVNKGMETKILVGRDYDKFMDIYIKTLSARSDIHGMTASSGKVSGVVRVCRTKDEIKDFKKGEILVAPMTRPEFVPAMKKASAIVTDEGGITCHAAIISRELSIPCIIGTKIATKLLKDGDLVEINANHGIVRKIK